MDKLYIKDLEVFANHGVFEEEKRLGQKFVISVTLDLDMHAAAVTGDLSKSVNYGEPLIRYPPEAISACLINPASSKLSHGDMPNRTPF